MKNVGVGKVFLTMTQNSKAVEIILINSTTQKLQNNFCMTKKALRKVKRQKLTWGRVCAISRTKC